MPKRINKGLEEHPDWVKPKPNDLFRFFSKVAKDGTCWRWRGHLDRMGYGQFHYRDRMWWAHRFALVALGHRPIKAGQEVHHSCRNPWCVNPDHLTAVSMSENRRLASVRREQ